MKINKEQIAFVVVVLLLGFMAWSRAGDETVTRGSRRSLGGETVDIESLKAPAVDLFAANEASWSPAGRNVYRAPSEYEALPPVPLPAPPRAPLPTKTPPTEPAVWPTFRAEAVKPLVPVSGVSLGDRADGGLDELLAEDEPVEGEGEDGEGETAPDGAEVSEVAEVQEQPATRLTRTEKRIETLRERLQRKQIDLIRSEREEKKAEAKRTRRLEELDRVVFGGESWYGEILNDARKRPGQSGLDRYALKLRIDAIRADDSLSAQQKEEALRNRDLEIEFRRWREGGFDRKQRISPTNVQAIEFGEGAVNVFEVQRRIVPASDAARHLELAKDLVAAGEHRLAKEHLQGMIEQGHGGREIFTALADAAHRDFDYDTEMKALSLGLEAFPDDAELISARAEIWSRLGLTALADEAFAKALELDARSARVNARFGRHVLRRADPVPQEVARAITHLERAAEGVFAIEADALAVRTDLGRAYLAAGRTRDAARAFDRVLDARPDDPEAALGRGVTQLLEGDVAGAVARFEAVLENDPLNGAAYYDLGLAALAEGRWEEARDRFQDAAEADPMLAARARAAEGWLREKIGDPAAAQDAYAAALEADPTDPVVLSDAGRGVLLMGDVDRAEELFAAAMERMPAELELLIARAETAFRQERYEDSLRFLDAVPAGKAPNDDVLVRRAQALMKLGRLDDAKQALDAAKQVRDSVELELNYAFYYYTLGNFDEALKRFRSVIKQTGPEAETPVAEYARTYEAAISDNLAKRVWTDRFDREAAGGDLLREWRSHTPGSGVQISLADNRVIFRGRQRQSGIPSAIIQTRGGKDFVSFEAELHVASDADLTAALGLMTFRKNVGNENALVDTSGTGIAYEALIFGKTPEGRIAWRRIERYEPGPWNEVSSDRWPAAVDGKATPVRLGIAVDDPKKGTFELTLNGVPVASGIEVKGLSRASRDVELWAFTQADIERRVEIDVDDVRIVTRQEN